MLENHNKRTKELKQSKKLKALQDVWIHAGTRLVKKGEIFSLGCGSCEKNLIANKQAEYINE